MDRFDTLSILSQAADWDAAAPRARVEAPTLAPQELVGRVREEAAHGICRVKRLGGGSTPILKVLLSNACAYDCAYCVNRRSANVKRATFQPEDLARTIADFSARGVIHGAFISSGVLGSPDDTMERLVWMARILRERYAYREYLHLKVIPGSSESLVHAAMRYATRVSVNIELPTEESLCRIAPDKSADAILSPMAAIHSLIREKENERDASRAANPLARARRNNLIRGANPEGYMSAGQTTQLIVGASPEPDSVILSLAQHLYSSFNVRRVYYSAFRPEGASPSLPHPNAPPFRREFRLYQADMLFRWYGFESSELFERAEYLDEDLDPKTSWALRHPEFFPVELMTADLPWILRVPGIGPRTARRILELRKSGNISFTSLGRMRVRTRLAGWFISIRGAQMPREDIAKGEFGAPRGLENPEALREFLREKQAPQSPIFPQFDFFA